MSTQVFLRDFNPCLRAAHAEASAKRRPFWLEMLDRILLSEEERAQAHRLRVSLHFKVCPLCEELNAIAASSCTTCTWHGGFNHDPYAVEYRFAELLRKCPNLEDDVRNRNSPRGMSFKVRVRTWIKRIFGERRIDIRV